VSLPTIRRKNYTRNGTAIPAYDFPVQYPKHVEQLFHGHLALNEAEFAESQFVNKSYAPWRVAKSFSLNNNGIALIEM
jgi:hypothetical protein